MCNVEQYCPKRAYIHKLSNDELSYIQQLLLDNSEKSRYVDLKSMRTCTTNTVCITKHFRLADGSSQMRYYCDNVFAESLRNSLLGFRDCKINTNVTEDRQIVDTKPEHCCNEHDYCNALLSPSKSIIDIVSNVRSSTGKSFADDASQHDNIGGSNGDNNNDIFNPINLAMIFCIVFVVSVFLFVLVVLINRRLKAFRKRNKKKSCAAYKHTASASSVLTLNNSNATNNHNNSNNINNTNSNGGAIVLSSNGPNRGNEPIEPAKVHSEPLHTNTTSLCNTSANDSPLMDSAKVPLLFVGGNGDFPMSLLNSNPSSSSYVTTSHTDKETVTSPFLSGPESNFSYKQTITENESTLSPLANKNYLNEYEWSGSGSGAGLPQCVALTIARQIKLGESIGKGRFGEVYKGTWRAGFVAVKTFNSADEKSWENECNIYNTNGFRHENILGFITADNIDRGTYTELWLITDYHENGSLFDYLSAHTVTPREALRMCLSIVNGLVHLHMPIESFRGKPALAHCDLKSKNVLVKSDLTCCLSDFGLALAGDRAGRIIHNGAIRTGTKRYMAPEILAKTVDQTSLNAFQKAEMYSLALIVWEILRRCKFELNEREHVYEYQLPFYECLDRDPDESTMVQIVCIDKRRPILNELWREVTILGDISNLIEELWTESPSQRLSALRVKKTLSKLLNK